MVIKSGLDVDALIDPEQGRVHRRVYTDPDIFELEMERVFERTWVYVAHESEVAEGGDYKTTFIGRQPVIVTRNADDSRVYVLLNSCRHKGAVVCVHEYGNANYFRCAYHGWTYTNTGALVGVPYPGAFGPDFEPRQRGLIPAARVDSYGGLIFASLSPDVPNLDEYLGHARPYIDLFVNQGGGIIVKNGVNKELCHANWKFLLENPVDNYHFQSTHQSQIAVRRRRNIITAARSDDPRQRPAGQKSRDLGNGHVISDYLEGNEERYAEGKCGPEFRLVLFPNVVLAFQHIRVIFPIAVDRTEAWRHLVLLKNAPAEVNDARMRDHEDFYTPAGLGGPDDMEMFHRVQIGLRAKANEWLLYTRNLYDEQIDEQGLRWAPMSEMPDTAQRGFHRQWKRLMTAV